MVKGLFEDPQRQIPALSTRQRGHRSVALTLYCKQSAPCGSVGYPVSHGAWPLRRRSAPHARGARHNFNSPKKSPPKAAIFWTGPVGTASKRLM